MPKAIADIQTTSSLPVVHREPPLTRSQPPATAPSSPPVGQSEPHFSKWSQERDPEGIAWQFDPKSKRFYPQPTK